MAAEWKTPRNVSEVRTPSGLVQMAGAHNSWFVKRVTFSGLFSDANSEAAVLSSL